VTATKEQAIQDLRSSSSGWVSPGQRPVPRQLLHGLPQERLNAGEIANVTLMSIRCTRRSAAIPYHGLSIAGFLSPTIFGLADGGMDFGNAIGAGSSILAGLADIASQSASIAALAADYQRRAEDWTYQQQLASSTWPVSSTRSPPPRRG